MCLNKINGLLHQECLNSGSSHSLVRGSAQERAGTWHFLPRRLTLGPLRVRGVARAHRTPSWHTPAASDGLSACVVGCPLPCSEGLCVYSCGSLPLPLGTLPPSPACVSASVSAATCRSKLAMRSCCACSRARRAVTSRPIAMMPLTWPAGLHIMAAESSTAMMRPSFVRARLVSNTSSFAKRPCCTARENPAQCAGR